MAQPAPTAHIVGVVDHGLDAQRPTVLQILFDARVPVEGVDVDLGAVGDDLGLVFATCLGAAALAAFEDQLDQLRAADVEVVGHQGLEEPAGPPRCVEHQGARHLHLSHRQLPPIAGGAVVLGQRQRQDRPPALGEHLDRARAEPVADRLQRGRISAGSEPVGQLGEPDPGLGRLPLGPLVTVDPDLHRVRKIGAHLDERRPETVVPNVEVVTGHPPLGHRKREPHRVAPLFLGGGEHRRELLRHPDRGHPRPAGRRLPGQIRPHHLDLAVVLAEPHHRDVVWPRRTTPPRGETPCRSSRR